MNNKDRVVNDTAAKVMNQSRPDKEWHSEQESLSVEVLEEVIRLISEVIFPETLLESRGVAVNHCVVINIDKIYMLMEEQIGRALKIKRHDSSSERVEQITAQFVESITQIKSLLTTDVEAIYKADPAATSYAEIILCYPSIMAMTHHRIAHSLHLLGVPIIPRVISEMAHSKCGIDIHPGATIGSHFAIDHGTGVVIGETTIIGQNVVIYQGVTLGAKGFRFDENGNAINIPRHPIIEDNVRIYSNSSILGRITIGHDSVIGGNMWVDKDIEPNSIMVKLDR